MAMNFNTDNGEEVIATINTTPLVDVMLVLLIIFLITIPVAVQMKQVNLPKELAQPQIVKPIDINISVDKDGAIYWNSNLINKDGELFARLKEVVKQDTIPEVHLRADSDVEYRFIAKVILDTQRAGIPKIGFITEPPTKD